MSAIPNEIRLDSLFTGFDLSQVQAEHVSKRIKAVVEAIAQRTTAQNGQRFDSASSMLAARDLEVVLAEALRDVTGPRYAERYIPAETAGVLPWTETYIQKRITRFGRMGYVTSADMPSIEIESQEVPVKVGTFGGKIEYGWMDLQKASQAGVPLNDEYIIAAREAAAEMRDTLMLEGDSALPKSGGYIPTGLINDATVPRISVSGGVWSGKTADQILTDVRTWLSTARTQSRRSVVFDTLLLPEAQLAQIEMTRVGSTSDKSIRQYLLENVEGLTTIGVLPQLAGAGLSGTDRALFYGRNRNVLRGVVPLPFQFLNPQEINMTLTIFGVERSAGVEIRRPFGLLYADGI